VIGFDSVCHVEQIDDLKGEQDQTQEALIDPCLASPLIAWTGTVTCIVEMHDCQIYVRDKLMRTLQR
jgi:hypothetical protein